MPASYTYLGACHEIAATDAYGNGVTLHGRRLGVLAATDVVEQASGEVELLKGGDGGRDVPAGGLDRDVIVGREIDAGVVVGAVYGIDLALLLLLLGEGVIVRILGETIAASAAASIATTTATSIATAASTRATMTATTTSIATTAPAGSWKLRIGAKR